MEPNDTCFFWLASLEVPSCYRIRTSFSIVVEKYSIIWINLLLLILSSAGNLGYLHFLALWIMLLQTFVCNVLHGYVFNSLAVELLSHMVIMFDILRNLQFPTVTTQFYIPNNKTRGFKFLHILVTLVIICAFNYSHPSGCEIVSHCGFDLHLSDNLHFMYLFAPCISSQ